MRQRIVWMGSGVFATLAIVAACGAGVGSSSQNDDPAPTNPKDGWVQVWPNEYTYKRCDGTTLVYRDLNRYSIDTVPNSPECK